MIMQYLLLWSGEKRGMRKARIPAVASAGLCGHWRNGVLFVPCRDSIRAALPYHYRKAFDRAAIWYDKHDDSRPAVANLASARGVHLLTIYLQPLESTV